MYSKVACFTILIAAACGATPHKNDPLEQTHLSAAEHEQQARAHDQAAAELDERAAQSKAETAQEEQEGLCYDDPLENVEYSGTEVLQPPRPCWTPLTAPSRRYRELAKEHRRIAAAHRAKAVELVTVEREACANLGATEVAQGAFAQRADIVEVAAVEKKGNVRGARIAFRRVPGLTGEWMTASLRCEAARAAAIGYPDDFMSYSPNVLPDVTTVVEETPDQIIVVVRSERSDMATAALGRARDLHAGSGPTIAPTTPEAP